MAQQSSIYMYMYPLQASLLYAVCKMIVISIRQIDFNLNLILKEKDKLIKRRNLMIVRRDAMYMSSPYGRSVWKSKDRAN